MSNGGSDDIFFEFLTRERERESYYYYSSPLVHDDRTRRRLKLFAVLNNRAIALIDRCVLILCECEVITKREFYGDGDDFLIVGE